MAFEWANEASRQFTANGYFECTTEERAWEIAQHAEKVIGIRGLADKLYEYIGAGYYSLSSPVWSNFGREGLPISCNGTYYPDSIAGMSRAEAEVSVMTKNGAGTSGFFGDIRPRGSKIKAGGVADGPVHFMRPTDTKIDVVSQGTTRRGNFAAYMPMEHPDIMEFLDCREEGSHIQRLSLGVTVTDDWLNAMLDGDEDKQTKWARVLEKRYESGFPYVVYIDNANRDRPDVYKAAEMLIRASNLCTEIMLPADEFESFVCDLMSMNLTKYEDWVGTDAVWCAIALLDAVMTEYIEKTDGVEFMEAPNRFARRHRALGLGSLGLHTALQQRGLAFGTYPAMNFDVTAHKAIYEQAMQASKDLAELLGEPELLEGYGRRNTTVCAVAPTKSSSFIAGQISEGIEPARSNYFTKNLAKGKWTIRNPDLKKVLEAHGEDTEETWLSILKRDGSVQHLGFLTDDEKLIYRTFSEIPPMAVIQHAAARQQWIDQGQSINLMIHPDTPVRDVNKLMIDAWRMGIKSLYYQDGINPAQQLVRDINSCSACEA